MYIVPEEKFGLPVLLLSPPHLPSPSFPICLLVQNGRIPLRGPSQQSPSLPLSASHTISWLKSTNGQFPTLSPPLCLRLSPPFLQTETHTVSVSTAAPPFPWQPLINVWKMQAESLKRFREAIPCFVSIPCYLVETVNNIYRALVSIQKKISFIVKSWMPDIWIQVC